MPQMCPNCSHNNRGKQTGGPCTNCGAELRGLLGKNEIVNGYSPQEVLGCGGFSAVYQATDVENDRQVALKELFNLGKEDIKRFEHEAGILERLSHEQLPRFYGHFEHKTRRYLVMQYIPGQSLHDIVLGKQKSGEKVRETVARGWADQLCDVLIYLHEEGIIHRDIKPDNVRLTPAGEIYLVDLGIAKEQTTGIPAETIIHGLTPGYAPIEQYSSKRSKYKGRTTVRTDVYSLGATLYTVVTGIIPPNAQALAARMEKLRLIDAINPQITNRFATTVERAMAIEPEDRFQTIADMQRSFEGATVILPPDGDQGADERQSDDTPVDQPGDEKDQRIDRPISTQTTDGPPFLFYDMHQANNLMELVHSCDERWEEAKEHLYEEHIERWAWLTNNSQWGLTKLARELRETEPNQDAGLDGWLERAAQLANTERKHSEVTLTSKPRAPVDLGQVREWGTSRDPIQVQLKIKGSRSRSSVVGCAPCLEVSTTEIDWPTNGTTTVELTLNPEIPLDVGEHDLDEAIWLETDHQRQTIAARIVVRPPIEIAAKPQTLDFGLVGPKSPTSLPLTIQNPGKEAWQGTLESVSWLTIKPQKIELDAGGQVEVEVNLNLHKEALDEPAEYRDPSAITLRVEDKSQSVLVQATVRPPISVTPKSLNFREVDFKRRPKRSIKLGFKGSAVWDGEIRPNVPWLEVLGIEEMADGESGASVTLGVQVGALNAPGTYRSDDAVVIAEQDGQEIVATLSARLVAVEPSLGLSATKVDFGQVTDAQSAPVKSITLHNPSLFDWKGSVRSSTPWLKVKPTRLALKGGADATLECSLTTKITGLEPEPIHQPDAISITGMEQEYKLEVMLYRVEPKEVKSTILEIAPDIVDFGRTPTWDQARARVIRLTNSSAQDLDLTIACTLSWVNIQPRRIHCPAGKQVELQASLDAKMARFLRDGPYVRPGAVSIQGTGEKIEIDVNLEIDSKAPPPPADAEKPDQPPGQVTGPPPPLPPRDDIEVQPQLVDFGQISSPSGQAKEILVTNHTGEKWSAWVHSVHPWLQVEPRSIDCLPGRKATISVRLNAKMFISLPTQVLEKESGITIRDKAGKKPFDIRVRVERI